MYGILLIVPSSYHSFLENHTMGAPLRFGWLRWVIKEHLASSLHWDLGLEICGFLLSWVLKIEPTMRACKEIPAIWVPHHKLEHLYLEHIIPKGIYGAGPKVIWDHGNYELRPGGPTLLQRFQIGRIPVFLEGSYLNGLFSLRRVSAKGDAWIFMKENDQYALDSWKSRRALSPEKLEQLRNKWKPQGHPQIDLFENLG
jgi:DNA ligase D-like protein (predicted 3'-phosphoesterase)